MSLFLDEGLQSGKPPLSGLSCTEIEGILEGAPSFYKPPQLEEGRSSAVPRARVARAQGDGFVIVDWLRQHNRLRQVPLVVYSARDLNDTDRERLKLGQTLFLTKGRIKPEEFERRVISLLNRIIHHQEGNSDGGS